MSVRLVSIHGALVAADLRKPASRRLDGEIIDNAFHTASRLRNLLGAIALIRRVHLAGQGDRTVSRVYADLERLQPGLGEKRRLDLGGDGSIVSHLCDLVAGLAGLVRQTLGRS